MKWYKPLCTLEVIADNLYLEKKSQKVFLYKDLAFSVWNKQKDLFDSEHEYWATHDGWLLKIERKHLANIVEMHDL
ncbi:MAG: hypothetical protein FJX80_00195 [Bacteroidetes bacterium]|nr:hypothetical protein [Bacteroidota bacterium]